MQHERNTSGLRPYPPGVTGHRLPKATRAVARLCREMTKEATERLGVIMRTGSDKDALVAIKEIYMRAIGKPLEAMDLAKKALDASDTLPVKVSELTDDQLARMLKIARENLP